MPTPSYFYKNHFNIILISILRSTKWPLSFGPSYHNFVYISLLSHVLHSLPIHPPWCEHPNNIQHGIQIMQHPTVEFFPDSSCFLPLGSSIFLSTLFSNTQWVKLTSAPQSISFIRHIKVLIPPQTPSVCYSLHVRDQVSHPHKVTCRITVLYILIFIFADSRWEDDRA
jgi:hypothetical protein